MQINERLANRKAKEIFEWIRKRGTVSKQDLKELSGMTSTTLTRILEELTGEGFIVETGLGKSTGGRRPILYQTNPRYAYAFGLDISRSSSRLVLCDLHLNKLDEQEWRMDASMVPDRLLEEAAGAAERMMERHRLPKDRVLGLGVGAVGPLDRAEGVILDPKYFPAGGWHNVEVRRRLESRLDIPVLLDNGANTALLGEYWLDSDRRFQHLLYVHAGVGIRTAMIMGGNVVHGAVDMEGAAGQMIIQCDGKAPRENSGNYGSWESYASIYALEQAMLSRIKIGRRTIVQLPSTWQDGELYARMLEALRAGDPLTRELFEQAACYFGIGLANLLNILHPEKVILGGPLVSANPFFFQYATQVAVQKTYHYPDYQAVFSQSRLGDDAVAVGAAVLVINQLTA